jgi:hypothetical protein
MPYLTADFCTKLEILPGAILEGDFATKSGLSGPHREDADYTSSKLSFKGPSSSAEFKSALIAGLKPSVEVGFEITLAQSQKHIPVDHPVKRSIITLAVAPGTIEIVEGYKAGTTKIHFIDGSGRPFKFLPITDLGFHRFADRHREAKDLARLNAYIRSQPEVYLRLGLSRAWQSPQGINGYWMQVNGVYTFPGFFPEIRSYKA